MSSRFPALLCDIGGTNARFALLAEAQSEIQWLQHAATADYSTFTDAIKAATAGGVTPASILVCAAGPVEKTRVKLTNANWDIDGRAVARDLGLADGIMFNDFEALALSIPSLQPSWLKAIGGGTASGGARVIHGPGTGLGTAALIDVMGKWRAIASEGSHSDFAPVSEGEQAIWPHVERRLGRITPETLISGPGLRRLHRARLASVGADRPEISEVEITQRAVANPSGSEGETVRWFWRLAARHAGDVALSFLATGGVFLAGGILPRLVGLLDEEDFRRAFENKAPYEELISRIPVHLVVEPDAVIHGLADIARHPDRYAIDFSERSWKRI
jgi:glucokinase